MRRDLDRRARRHVNAQLAQGLDLGRIVGNQVHRAHTEVGQHARGDPVLTFVRAPAQSQIGFNRVKALILEVVRPQLVSQTNSAALLA